MHPFSNHRRSGLFANSALVLLPLLSACATESGTAIGDGERAAALWADGWRYDAAVEPVVASNGMVVSTDVLASAVGNEILEAGGNAVDAAIAVQFALAVVNPEAGNIGGGGFMVVRDAQGEVRALDFREQAPGAATRDMYLDADGNVTDRSVVGHLAAGVPGTVAGMWAAHETYGSMPWADLVAPSVTLAEGS